MANVLGAPTEGLGQNITFAPQEVGAQSLDLTTSQGAVQTGMRGGPSGVGGTQVHGVQAEPYSNPVVDTLIGLAGKAVQAKVKEKKTEAYVAGMQRAANGEAISEIAKDQPWYATMFGDTDVVEGARWYTGHAVAQETASSFDEDMHNLRRLSPDEARSTMSARIQERLTGDAATDATILQSMTQVMPGIFKRHTKEHAGFLNEEAATAMSASVQAAGRRLQVVAKNRAPSHDLPGYSDAELAQTLSQFYTSQAKPAGMTDKTYVDVKVNALEHMARQGNFHAISALEAGGWVDAALPVEERDKFRAVVAREQEKAKTKWGADNTEQIARIETWAAKSEGGKDSFFIKNEITKLNRAMSEQTGIELGYFSPEREAALMSRSAVGILQAKEREHEKALVAAEKAGKAGDDAAKEATIETAVRQAIVDRSLPQLQTKKGITSDVIDGVTFQVLFNENKDPKQRASTIAQLSQQNGYSSPLVKKHFERTISSALGATDAASGVMPDAFLGAYREYKELRAYGPEVAADTYGKYGARLEGLYKDEQANIPLQQGFISFLRADEQRAKLNPDDLKKAVSSAAKVLRPGIFGLYTKELHPSAARQLAVSIEDPAARWMGSVNGASLDDAVKVSLKSQAARNLEVAGQYIIHGSDNTTKFRTYLTSTDGPNGKGALPTDKWEDVFEDAIDEAVNGKAGKYGALFDEKAHIVIRQLPDKAGVPQLNIMALGGDGTYGTAIVSGDDIFKLAQAKRDKIKAQKKIGTTASSFGMFN